jgi:large subunit ribosomal protein L7/L12
MATIDEKIAEIEEQAKKKIQQLKAKKELIEARKVQALIKGKRSKDTRRKILAGAMTLEISERDEEARQRFIKQMDKYLTRPDDRALFDLPEAQNQVTPSIEKKEKGVQPEKVDSNQRK